MSDPDRIEASADYVIVGAGSAGCVIASRLSEDGGASVLLLEAGGPAEGEVFTVPALWGRQFGTKYDWQYFSEPEAGLGGRRNQLPRGKSLGGTSSMNGMVYVRGAQADFDEWEHRGASGWGWRDVLPYFTRAEGNERGESDYHGGSGPLRVSDRISPLRVVDAWVEAAINAGHPVNEDFNGPTQEGVGFYQLTQEDGVRCSSSAAYLEPAAGRGNLQIVCHAHVRRILFDGTRAVGAEIERFGDVQRVTARREVIVSTGAYNTPQLLMLSGIGPRDHLAGFGIDTLMNLPVGENLQDHPCVPLVLATDEPTFFGVDNAENRARYREQHRGPLASNGVEAGGFFRTQQGLDECDCQAVVIPSTFFDDGRAAVVQSGFTVAVEVTRPTSRGKVRLRALEPSAQPRITHNHFTTREDRDVVKRGMLLHAQILDHAPIARMRKGRLRWPRSLTDAGLEQFIRQAGLGAFHPTSTCAIGSVVDPELRVYGVEGLRVADASVMPNQIRGNPNAAAIMIGEKAADLIRQAGREPARVAAATT
jgi:choline dehydrogenase-like flavoprotein